MPLIVSVGSGENRRKCVDFYFSSVYSDNRKEKLNAISSLVRSGETVAADRLKIGNAFLRRKKEMEKELKKLNYAPCFFKYEEIKEGSLFFTNKNKKTGIEIWEVTDIFKTYNLKNELVKTEVSAKRLNFPFPCSGNFSIVTAQRFGLKHVCVY